jgi:hypothetical protein
MVLRRCSNVDDLTLSASLLRIESCERRSSGSFREYPSGTCFARRDPSHHVIKSDTIELCRCELRVLRITDNERNLVVLLQEASRRV